MARAALVLFLAALSGGRLAHAATREVGPSKAYATPCAAIAAATDGDLIEVDAAGTYDGDVCGWSTNGLTIRGVNGRAHIDAAGANSGGKATWVIGGDDTVIDNIELSGATVPDTNGAGIRQEGANLTLRRCYFHDNENGILTGADLTSLILIEYSEFAYNGYGDGYTHNMYIGHVGRFIIRHSYSHHAKIGHLVKSRAAENLIIYNRLSDEATGTASYELDLPNGGTSWVIGNVIHQGPGTDNPNLLAYREENGTADNPGTDLYVVNNTFVNDGPTGIFVVVNSTTPAIIKNNAFIGSGTLTGQATAVLANNYTGSAPLFADASTYDYHPLTGSPLVEAGVDPGMGGGISLVPYFQYVHPASREGRVTVGVIDIGAFELNGSGPDDGAPMEEGAPRDGAAGDPGATDPGRQDGASPPSDSRSGDPRPGDARPGDAKAGDGSAVTPTDAAAGPELAGMVSGCVCSGSGASAAWVWLALAGALAWRRRAGRR